LGRFITFEGVEGSGKTTQIQMLSDHLETRGVDHVLTREPGGTAVGNQVRRLVLNPEYRDMTPSCELLLYAAARAQHIEEVIRPALAEGRLVLCDRFTDATLAYQGYGRGIPLDLIRSLHELEVLSLKPDLTVVFDIDARAALQRARSRDSGAAHDESRFEREDFVFHERVRRGYLDLVRWDPKRYVVLDAAGTVEEVHRRVLGALAPLLPPAGA
jgi:dTMP kinase